MSKTDGIDETFIFQLSKELSYGMKDGAALKTATIEFFPPGMDELKESSDLDQVVMGALMSATRKAKRPDSEPTEAEQSDSSKLPTAQEIKMLFYSSDKKDVNINDINDAFKKIAFKTSDLGDGTKLNEAILKKIGLKDFKAMMCGYAAFFIFPSLLSDD